MSLESLHFLRPQWLWALALLPPIVWSLLRRGRGAGPWERVCDPHLLRHLLAPDDRRASRWPALLFAVAWTGACFALAGPAWERLPQSTFKEPSRTVFVLALGDSMNQRDVRPSRLARARYKLLDALSRTAGSVALVVYREEGFAVTPLTDDAHVLREVVPLLETSLMPGRTVLPARGLEEARRLLEPVGLRGARIVLLTDGGDDDRGATGAALKAATKDGAHVSVLAVGGDTAPLEGLARSSGAAFASLSVDDTDLDRVLARPSDLDPTADGALTRSDVRTEDWKDMGAWLVWIPLLLGSLAFRRGWAAALLALLFLQLSPAPAEAGVLDAFQRPDQRGAKAFAEGRFAESAQQFADPAWQGAARYRAGDFAGAAQALAATKDPGSQYNLGNALAKAGKLEEAVAAYDRALAAAPGDADAKFNRDLVKKLLDQQKPDAKSSSKDGAAKNETSDAKDGKDGAHEGQPDPKNGAQGSQSGSADTKEGQKEGPQDGQDGASKDDAKGQTAGQPPEDEGAGTPKSAAERQAAGDAKAQQAPQPSDASPGSDASGGDPHATASAGGKPGEPESNPAGPPAAAARPMTPEEQERAQWMARLPDDPGGLLREKIRRDYLRKQAARGGEDRS